MITDKMIFSNAQAVTTSGTTTATNVLDIGEAANPNFGAGTEIWVCAIINTAFTCLSVAATLQAQLLDCATSGGTFQEIAEGLAFSNGEVTKGQFLLVQPIPAKHKRYLKMTFGTGTGSGWSAGNIDAYLAPCAPRT